jgi:FkbM family methyltransferase
MTRAALGTSLRRLLNRLPRSSTLFKLCRMYVNFYSGQDNPDFRTNGEARALQQLLSGVSVAFDVGANVGDWTAMALELNRTLQIHCFEPSVATFAELTARGFPDRVVRNQFALGERVEQAKLFVYAGRRDVSSLHQGAVEADASGDETISVDTVDHYCQTRVIERIDYLKIDTEGHDLFVLRGAERMLRSGAIGLVQLEYGPAYLPANVLLRDVFALMVDCGYRGYKILPRGLLRVEKYSVEYENFRLSNWIFSRSEAL